MSPDTTAPARNDALDGLRAVAVSAVFLYHARVSWAQGGYLGVSVFFALSGYLITRNLLRDVAPDGGFDARRFYARRARRLVPASAVAIAAASIVGAIRAVRPSALEITAALTGWKNWQLLAHPSLGDVLVVWWSLAVEEQYYLVYPLLLLLLWRLGGRRALAIGLTAVTGASLGALAALTAAGHVTQAYYGTHTRLWELLLGCLLAVAGGLPARLRMPAWLALAVVALCQTDWLIDHFGHWQHPCRVVLTVVATVALIDALERDRTGAVHRTLSWRPVRWVGAVSYEVYLVHTIVILALPALGGVRLFSVGGAYALVLAAAATLHALTSTRSRWARTAASGPPR